MAVASAADLALLRLFAGRIAEVTDRLISERVYSYRITPNPDPDAPWKFRARAWMAFVNEGLTILDRGDSPFMCRTDVTRFYESIRTETLERTLYASKCDRASVEQIVAKLRFWREKYGKDGLPIGPEGCAILGSYFLDPVDRSIISTGVTHRRYGDDFLIFTDNNRLSGAIIDLLDEALNDLHLARSEEKTIYFEDPEDAKASLRNLEIDYLQSAVGYDSGLGGYAVRRAFDRFVYDADEVSASKFRWILRFLMHKSDDYGCRFLSGRQDLMNIDPKVASEYLKVAKSDDRVLENCMRRLSQKPETHLEA